MKNKKNNVTLICIVNVRITLWAAWTRKVDSGLVFFSLFTVVQVAGDGGMGEDEVVEVGVLLECWKISSSRCECPGGEVATSVWAAREAETRREKSWHDHLTINNQVTYLWSSGDTRRFSCDCDSHDSVKVRSFYTWRWSSGVDLVFNKLCVEVTAACKSTCKLQFPDQ